MMTFASSTSRYEVVPPPAPKTAARPATLGACQVLLQLSMLLLPTAVRMNFWAAKFTSLVAFEQLNMPKEVGPCRSMMPRIPLAAQSSACSQVAGRSFPFSRMRGSVSRCGDMALSLRSLAECLQRSAQRIPAFLARPKPMRGPLEHFKPGFRPRTYAARRGTHDAGRHAARPTELALAVSFRPGGLRSCLPIATRSSTWRL